MKPHALACLLAFAGPVVPASTAERADHHPADLHLDFTTEPGLGPTLPEAMSVTLGGPAVSVVDPLGSSDGHLAVESLNGSVNTVITLGPADAPLVFTVPLEIEMRVGLEFVGSVGVYVIDQSDADNNLLALAKLHGTQPLDLLRFYRDASSPNTSGQTGTAVGRVTSAEEQIVVSSKPIAAEWVPLRVSVSTIDGVPTLTMSLGELVATSTFRAEDAVGEQVHLALRVFEGRNTPGAGAVRIDQLSVRAATE